VDKGYLVEKMHDYLYRIASSGFSAAARVAGKTPVRKPTIAENEAMKTMKMSG
jgi:hypothetical protein